MLESQKTRTLHNKVAPRDQNGAKTSVFLDTTKIFTSYHCMWYLLSDSIIYCFDLEFLIPNLRTFDAFIFLDKFSLMTVSSEWTAKSNKFNIVFWLLSPSFRVPEFIKLSCLVGIRKSSTFDFVRFCTLLFNTWICYSNSTTFSKTILGMKFLKEFTLSGTILWSIHSLVSWVFYSRRYRR